MSRSEAERIIAESLEAQAAGRDLEKFTEKEIEAELERRRLKRKQSLIAALNASSLAEVHEALKACDHSVRIATVR